MYLEGIEIGNNKEYKNGYKLLTSCASVGHGRCVEVPGWAYYSGEGTKEDFDAAVKWLKVAWQTGTNYGFAGLSGAVSITEYYCDHIFSTERVKDPFPGSLFTNLLFCLAIFYQTFFLKRVSISLTTTDDPLHPFEYIRRYPAPSQ